MRLCVKINNIHWCEYTLEAHSSGLCLCRKGSLCYGRLVTWPSGRYDWSASMETNDERKCPNTVLYSGFSEPILQLWFQSLAGKILKKEIEKITCRDTFCGREMITSVRILNLWQNSKSYPDAGNGEHFLHFRNNTQRTHPSVCCKKMSKSHVYPKKPQSVSER